jgi:hypothetical protein
MPQDFDVPMLRKALMIKKKLKMLWIPSPGGRVMACHTIWDIKGRVDKV